jgi:hypothetical protein
VGAAWISLVARVEVAGSIGSVVPVRRSSCRRLPLFQAFETVFQVSHGVSALIVTLPDLIQLCLLFVDLGDGLLDQITQPL